MAKKTILIGYPYWGRGGAEVATMWLMEALRDEYDLYLITRGGWDLDDLNKISGTRIDNSEIKLLQLPLHRFLRQTFLGLIWHSIYLKLCRHYARKFDLCITGSRTINWGRQAVHILSDVEWNVDLAKQYNVMPVLSESVPIKIYKWIARIIEGNPSHKVFNDFYIANSLWTAQISRPYMHKAPRVVYPPVPQHTGKTEFDPKNNDFLYLGRISPEKRLEVSIEILNGVREVYPELRFHIAGFFDNSPYAERIKDMCSPHRWIILHGAVYGNAKQELLNQFSYSINARAHEPFGISTAEMVNAGIIPFGFNDGGQKEIIIDNRLLFSNKEEAVEKIISIIDNTDLAKQIIKKLQKGIKKFSSKMFVKNMRQTVDQIFEEKNS